MLKPESSDYVLRQRRDYSLYVMRHRSIPSVTDGLKAGGRRALWVARDGKKFKTATLAGAVMPLHPHAEVSSSINTLAAPYGNNIPLFDGEGAFGTRLAPTNYGASRYTSVTVSPFALDAVLRDIDLIPMVDNYDSTLQEPVHFIPLIPLVLLNPAEGIAVGFATNILPRSLGDIVGVQLLHLKHKKLPTDISPYFAPTDSAGFNREETDRGVAYTFRGRIERTNTTTAVIVDLPYAMTHDRITAKLNDLVERGAIVDFVDNSRDQIKIEVKFARGRLAELDDDALMKLFGLVDRQVENLNVLDFTGQRVWKATPIDLIAKYTDWRLSFYVKRYERMLGIVQHDLQRYYDIRLAIAKNIGGVAKKIQSRAELKNLLTQIGIVSVDYIADLPVYRFTEEEHRKNEERITMGEAEVIRLTELINSDELQRNAYADELMEIRTKYAKTK